MEDSCLFCLDPVKPLELAFNPIGCSCQFKSHGSCLQAWFEEKHTYECPICHTVSVPNPVQPVYQIVYVQREEPTRQRRFYDEISPTQQICAGVCCFGILLWWIVLTIVEYAIKK